MFPASFTIVFKIVWRASVGESVFSKATWELSISWNSAENSKMCIGMSHHTNLTVLETSRSPHLTGVTGLQSTLQKRTSNQIC